MDFLKFGSVYPAFDPLDHRVILAGRGRRRGRKETMLWRTRLPIVSWRQR
jgi:hypothetical protein